VLGRLVLRRAHGELHSGFFKVARWRSLVAWRDPVKAECGCCDRVVAEGQSALRSLKAWS
jgi:hypothetical protein